MRFRHYATLACLVLFAAPLAPNTAAAQIAVVVNGQAITDHEIAQRQRLLTLSAGGRAASRTQAVDELIDERLKLQEARRQNVTIPDSQVEQAITNIAQRTRLTVDQFSRALGQRGVQLNTLRTRLRADMAWQQVMQTRAQRTIRIRDQDVIDAIRRRGQDPDRLQAFEYQLVQVVVFGTSADRRRSAESLRGAISGCDTLRDRVRNVRDAAARDPVRRVNQELPEQMRTILDNTTIGRATPIQQTERGFEFAVVCERRPVPGREAVSAQVRQELMGQEVETASRTFLTQLRERAVIERRRP